jgi:hypothetical protein
MRRIFLSIMSLMLLLFAASCSDFLDLEPISEATDQTFWDTQDDANSAVAAMYALTRQAFNYSNGATFYAYGDLPSDEFGAVSDTYFEDVRLMNWSRAVASSETANVLYRLRRYDLFYRIIDQANRVIQRLPEMDASAFSSTSAYNHLLGEAYFMRAFTYFFMARVWGAVPLVITSAPTTEAMDVPVSSVQEVLTQVRADIDAAKPLLSWNNLSTADFSVRGNKGALFALEAHYAAWIGEYETCSSAADSVIQSGRYSYVGRDSVSYRRIFAGQSAEGIFEISQNGDNEGTISGIGSYTLISPYIRDATVPTFQTVSNRMDVLFDESGDLREQNAFNVTANPSYAICTKYANVSYTAEGSSGVRIFKNNIVIFRYADIVLLRAEALAATGRDAEAMSSLNEVRGRAGLPAWSQNGDLFEEVIQERARELFLEGHRFYDLIRLARRTGRVQYIADKMNNAEFAEGKYFWPFDPTLMVLNPLLRQTPYWTSVN